MVKTIKGNLLSGAIDLHYSAIDCLLNQKRKSQILNSAIDLHNSAIDCLLNQKQNSHILSRAIDLHCNAIDCLLNQSQKYHFSCILSILKYFFSNQTDPHMVETCLTQFHNYTHKDSTCMFM